MDDKQVGEVWEWVRSACDDENYSAHTCEWAVYCSDLIRELVNMRAERKLMACPHGGLSAAACRHPSDFHLNEAFADFGIDPETWK